MDLDNIVVLNEQQERDFVEVMNTVCADEVSRVLFNHGAREEWDCGREPEESDHGFIEGFLYCLNVSANSRMPKRYTLKYVRSERCIDLYEAGRLYAKIYWDEVHPMQGAVR